MKTKDKIRDYSFMIASKITKYIVNNAYIREKINYYIDDIYEIVKDNSDEIKNVVYNSKKINGLINSVTERVYYARIWRYGKIKYKRKYFVN